MKRILAAFAALLLCLPLAGFADAAGITATPLEPEASGLRISEVMASNKKTLEDSFGNSADWLELHNPTDLPIDLSGLCLSDSKKELERFRFPDGLVLEPDAYLIVFCSGLKRSLEDELHTPFKLSAKGETLYLTQNGLVVDLLTFPSQEKDIAYALCQDGTYAFTASPTPGGANVITPTAE